MNKPIIKENSFSVDEIHKIREYHYEMTKNMTNKEIVDEINKKAKEFKEKMREKRKKKEAV